MGDSAFVGSPPANAHDKAVIEGFWRNILRHAGPGGPPHPPVIPARKPPGPVPHDNQQRELIAIDTFLIVAIVALTGTRCALRFFRRELRWGLDDWTIIIGAVFGIAWLSQDFASLNDGIAMHMYDMTYTQIDNFTSNILTGVVCFYLSIAFIKISICLFNRRLTGLTSRNWNIYHNTLLVLLVAFTITVIFTFLFACYPVWTLFRWSDLGSRNYMSKCLDFDHLSMGLSIMHPIYDLFLLPVPLIIMQRIRMSLSQRIRLWFLFSIGLLSFVGAINRVVLLFKREFHDRSYDYLRFNRWGIIDFIFAVAVANLPTLNALLPKRWRQGDRDTSGALSANREANSDSTRSPQNKSRVQRAARDDDIEAASNEDGQEKNEDDQEKESWGTNGHSGRSPRIPWTPPRHSQPDWEAYHPNFRVAG